MTKGLKLVFLGTPDFAVPSLEALARSEDSMVLAVCQPDRPSGRGRKLTPPPVKIRALELGIPVWQPDSVRTSEALDTIRGLNPDILVVVAFGKLLPRPLLDLPRLGTVNLHPSLLPAHRGPAPINWAILEGKTETGVTTIFLDEGMDTGPILLARSVAIGPDETAGQLGVRLADLGADLVVDTIQALKQGTVTPRPQEEAGASQGRLLSKEDGLIDWTRPATELAAQVRGLDPWPGAFSSFNGKNLKLFGARVGPGQGAPGEILTLDNGLIHIAAGRGSLALAELQIAGKKKQPAEQFWNGQRISRPAFLGRES